MLLPKLVAVAKYKFWFDFATILQLTFSFNAQSLHSLPRLPREQKMVVKSHVDEFSTVAIENLKVSEWKFGDDLCSFWWLNGHFNFKFKSTGDQMIFIYVILRTSVCSFNSMWGGVWSNTSVTSWLFGQNVGLQMTLTRMFSAHKQT